MLNRYAMKEPQLWFEEANLQLMFELFHYIQKLVVDVGLVMKLDLDCIEVAKSVCDIKRTVNGGVTLGVDG
jgi:hypothetical protein